MNQVTDKLCSQDVCTGCFACKQVCAKDAIHKTEIKGFLYPEIDASLCVDCGLCTKACPVLNNHLNPESKHHDEKSYAIWNKNVEDRVSSSSGGVFSALADKTLQEGGVVYGAAWDENMQLRHIGIDEPSKLDALRRSKYVQSNTDGVYKDVKNQLKAGRKVLFCGTPCQVAGLLSFLGNKEYPNMITAGVVCHGVPSQKSFDNYLRGIEEEKKIKIYDCNFRSKEYGWRTGLNLLVHGKNKVGNVVRFSQIGAKNVFSRSFLKQYFLRDSCYNCPFKGCENACHADIMLSDAWSLWSKVSLREVDFSKGISAVATYTDKGREALNQCSDALAIMERPYSEYASNSGLRNARKPKNNDAAFEYLKTHTWRETQDKFFPMRVADYFSDYTRKWFGENNYILIKKIVKKITRR